MQKEIESLAETLVTSNTHHDGTLEGGLQLLAYHTYVEDMLMDYVESGDFESTIVDFKELRDRVGIIRMHLDKIIRTADAACEFEHKWVEKTM